MVVQNALNLSPLTPSNQSRSESCHHTDTGHYIISVYTVVWTAVFFPLFFLVLYVGFQRWRRDKRSTVTHTDFFTYNMLFTELINVSGYVTYSVGAFYADAPLISWGTIIMIWVYPVQMWFHVFTCVERYLAVVHPVIYMNLRKRCWIWARNMTILFVWMDSFLSLGLFFLFPKKINGLFLIKLFFVICIIVFCSVSVLRVLRNPGPGEGSRAGQSKQKAFYTILIILADLLLWLLWYVICFWIETAYLIDLDLLCELRKASCWFSLPSRLVLPLLFLHRAGKLPRCGGKKNTDTNVMVMTKM